MSLISICIPVLNEEDNVLNAFHTIDDFFKKDLSEHSYEIIFTDNDSADDTENIITELAKKNKNIKYIRFKKNLGYDKSILEGYKNSNGEAAIVIHCDLQDPIGLIKNFITEWKKGHDVVYGIIKTRKESLLFTFLRNVYYKIMNVNSESNYPLGAGDFRLVDKKVINRFANNNNLYPYVRGLTFSLSNNPKGIEYDRTDRKFGKSKLGYYGTFTYAISYLIEETRIFVRFFARFNLTVFAFSIIFSLFNIYLDFKFFSLFQNLILLLLVILIFICTIISEYILRIYFQIKKENKTIYKKQINL